MTAYDHGWNAFFDGVNSTANPYIKGTLSYNQWLRGWEDALDQFERTS